MEKEKKMTKNIKKKKKPMKFRKFFLIIDLLLIVASFFLVFNLFKVDVLSARYLYIAIGGIVLIDVFLMFILNRRFKLGIKIPILILAIIFMGLEVFGTYNLGKTVSFVQEIVGVGVKEEIYNIYVLTDSKYEKTDDLVGAKLGIYNNGADTLEDALKDLKKEVTFKDETTYDNIEALLNDGVNKKTDALFVSSSMEELINENYPELFSKFKLLDKITIKVKETVEQSDVNVTKEPFIVYISGIDTYGSIGTVSRSDVNILAVINPKTNKILLVNTPRDYYIKLNSKKAYDKLTHAGIYGIEESLKTLEDLYVTDIDFYFKINFSSLIKIVDTIGGITVNSKYSFSYDGFTFRKGTNNLSGKAALAFSRCRKELPNGDISRGENQEAVIQAIINKVSNPSIITKYTSILSILSKSFVTNMDEQDIYDLAKYQLNNSPTWSLSSVNANGTSASRTTYSAGRTKLYVMIPDEASVIEVKHAINEILEEEKE